MFLSLSPSIPYHAGLVALLSFGIKCCAYGLLLYSVYWVMAFFSYICFPQSLSILPQYIICIYSTEQSSWHIRGAESMLSLTQFMQNLEQFGGKNPTKLQPLPRRVRGNLWGHALNSFANCFCSLFVPVVQVLSSVQFSSVARLCPTLCYPMDCSVPGLPVHHQLLEFTQTHAHWISDGILPSHPLSSPSPPTFNLRQHQGLFQWVISSHQVAKVLELQLQHQSFQWTLRTDFL